MTTLQLNGYWNVARQRLKQGFGGVRGHDLQYVEGLDDEVVGRIQKRLGETRDEVEKLLDECSCECG